VTAVATVTAIKNASRIRLAFVNHPRKNVVPTQYKVPIAIARP